MDMNLKYCPQLEKLQSNQRRKIYTMNIIHITDNTSYYQLKQKFL